MGKTKRKTTRLGQVTNKWGSLVLAFLLPFLGFLAVLFAFGCEPFGNDRAILYSDEYHQYYPFFVAFRHSLLRGESLMQNWQIGMGVDYLGLIAYYLGSPLNLLSVLVPESLTLELFAMLVPLRLGLAGLFFALMLKKLYGKSDISIALFGAFYGFCAWALGYQWNVMWLDTFALLPLVILGTISLLRDKKFILYTVTLFLSVAINYYIGLFTCIFVLLVFICYEICRFQGFKRLGLDLLRIACFSALAIGMTAFLSLPTLASLGNTNSSANNFPKGFRLNIVDGKKYPKTVEAWKALELAKQCKAGFGTRSRLLLKALLHSFAPLIDGMGQVAGNMGGGIRYSFKEGLPNVYCGVVVLVFAVMFLTAKKVKLRDKLCSVGLLVFFMLSFMIRQLDYIWHGFHFPNMIPYRFSFLFSFVVLWMGYRAWLLHDAFKLWQVIVGGVLTAGIFLCYRDPHPTYIAFNITFLALTMALFAFILITKRRNQKRMETADKRTVKKLKKQASRSATLLLALLMIGELCATALWFVKDFRYTTITNYPKGGEDMVSAVNYMKYRERNNLFYRTEVTHTQTFNDAPLNDYNGITTFTSSANVRSTDFMDALGYGARRGYNRYAFEEGSPVANLFLNLKYMIERDGDVEENAYFDEIYNFGDVYLLENNAYLPLGFLANSELADWYLKDGTYAFERQQNLFTAATGIEEALWTMTPEGCLSIVSEDVPLSRNNPKTGRVSYASKGKGTITYGYTATAKGLMCLEINAPQKNKFRVYHKPTGGNERELFSDSISLDQMLSVCEVNPGDLVRVDFTIDANESATLNVQAGILNEAVFREGYELLAASTMELTQFSNTKVSGEINCNRDGLLYTSIPHNGNWTVKVDGKKADVVLVGSCMVGVELTEGRHTITFRYRNKSFTTGLIVSILCALIFAAIIFLLPYLRNQKGKFALRRRPAAGNARIPAAEPEKAPDTEKPETE